MLKSCPECNVTWEAKETIFDHFRSKGHTVSEARESASHYGCTPENPKHFGVNMMGIEIPGKYDGVSYWKCTECNTIFDRWTQKPAHEKYDQDMRDYDARTALGRRNIADVVY